MRPEILSTGRPSALRLAGFVTLAAGAVLAGVGATRPWATVGFPEDRSRSAALPVHGTDVWEGKVVLFGAVVALVALLGMRLARSEGARRALGVLLVALGVAAVALPLADAARAEERFGGGAGADRYAEWLSARLSLPEDVVRATFEEQFHRALRVDVEPALWGTAGGGVLLVAGGVLGLAWAGRSRVPTRPEGGSP
jgi:hypothetical protein